MSKSEQYNDSTNKIRKCWPALYGDIDYIRGTVDTPHGIVKVYCWPGITTIRMIVDGIEYRRHWKADFSQRYLVTLARRFSEDVAAKKLCTFVQ